MVRQISSESEMQEIINNPEEGKRPLVIIHFFDPFFGGLNVDELRKKLDEISIKSPISHWFTLVEINKFVKNSAEKEELKESTENLMTEYLPGYTRGVGNLQPELVFIRKEGTKWEPVYSLVVTEEYVKSNFENHPYVESKFEKDIENWAC